MPRRNLKAEDRRAFIQRRDALYALCTSVEQQCLIKLARLYGSHRRPLFPPSDASQAVFARHLRSLVGEEANDVLLGVIHFCRALPLEVGGSCGLQAFEGRLKDLARQCVESLRTPPSRRMATVLRSIRAAPQSRHASELRDHAWPLLLEAARQDMATALALIDEHWREGSSSDLLSTICLHEQPEVAYQLAVKLQPHRPAFAADMLRCAIFYTSFRYGKADQGGTTALDEVMDAYCRLLAEWTLVEAPLDAGCMLMSMDRLFQFGNPAHGYWPVALARCLAVIRDLPPSDRGWWRLRLLAQLAFYGPPSSPLADEAHALFRTCVAGRLEEALEADGWSNTIDEISKSLDILEQKVLSRRNRRIAAVPDHPLRATVEAEFDRFLGQLLARQPSQALSHLVTFTLELEHQMLIRQHHDMLRAEFEARARLFPADAGMALRTLIAYADYSQVDDQMFRKELCKATFAVLLPILAGISPEDAAVARSGENQGPWWRDC